MALFTALAVASTATNLLGQIQQRQADKEVNKFNQRELFRKARLTQLLAQEDVDIARQAQASQRGQTLVDFANRGVRIDAGTPLDVLTAQLRVDEFNNSRTLFAADLQARDLRQQAEVVQFQGRAQKQQSNLSMFGGLLSGGGGILGTLGGKK